jgi:hypothetical protein
MPSRTAHCGPAPHVVMERANSPVHHATVAKAVRVVLHHHGSCGGGERWTQEAQERHHPRAPARRGACCERAGMAHAPRSAVSCNGRDRRRERLTAGRHVAGSVPAGARNVGAARCDGHVAMGILVCSHQRTLARWGAATLRRRRRRIRLEQSRTTSTGPQGRPMGRLGSFRRDAATWRWTRRGPRRECPLLGGCECAGGGAPLVRMLQLHDQPPDGPLAAPDRAPISASTGSPTKKHGSTTNAPRARQLRPEQTRRRAVGAPPARNVSDKSVERA